MSDPISTDITESPPPRRALSPALLVFLIFPLVGLMAAATVLLSNTNVTPAAVTPMPVTVPPQATRPQLSGQPAPDFSLTTLDGAAASLAHYRGRVVFLNFWATWCIPCERELPTFKAFVAQQPADGAVVLAVNVGETAELVQPYLNEREIAGFPILLDTQLEVTDRYGIGPIPVTFVIDDNGTIRFTKYGEMHAEDLTEYLDNLVE
jgi:peroxiredoxin